MAHPRPACSCNSLKRACSLDVDYGLPAAKRQQKAQSKCLVRANEGVNNASDKPERTREPHAHDVLCGRGSSVNNHPGNVIFRRLVKANKERYRTCVVNHKILLSKSILLAIRGQSPPGRFLTQLPGGSGWVEVCDAKALKKTSQTLREGSTEGDLQIDVSAEPGSTRPRQEEMYNVVLQLAPNGFSNCRGTMKMPDSAVSSQLIENEVMNSPCQAAMAAHVLIGGYEITNSSEVDSATIEQSTSESIRDLSSVASGEIQLCGLAAPTLLECQPAGDEALHSISDDESLLSPYSDTDCLEALHFLHEDIHDASFGLLAEFEIDMDHGEDDLVTDLIGHELC
ncbi:hypothetical protein MHU86_25405 [Fragilaria crotonensis]|nr:hypothetical protein MHU86_25405 [Fragilaria crotonensis]